jgi:hypothetical protein
MRTYGLGEPKLYDEMVADKGLFPGIYRLHFQRAPGTFDTIPRLLGSDELGILYIGTSVSVPYRIASLKKSVSAAYERDGYIDPSAHQCGKKIIQSLKFRQRFPFKGLCLTVLPCEPDNDAVGVRDGDHTRLEWKLLSEYFSEFGEFPPLNG